MIVAGDQRVSASERSTFGAKLPPLSAAPLSRLSRLLRAVARTERRCRCRSGASCLGLSQKRRERRPERRGPLGLALPNGVDLPPETFEQGLDPGISDHVPLELRRPESCSRTGLAGGAATGVPVPEASMNKDNGAASGQHDVRRAGQGARRGPKPEPRRVKCPPADQLRRGIFAPYAAHVLTPRRVDRPISHIAAPYLRTLRSRLDLISPQTRVEQNKNGSLMHLNPVLVRGP